MPRKISTYTATKALLGKLREKGIRPARVRSIDQAAYYPATTPIVPKSERTPVSRLWHEVGRIENHSRDRDLRVGNHTARSIGDTKHAAVFDLIGERNANKTATAMLRGAGISEKAGSRYRDDMQGPYDSTRARAIAAVMAEKKPMSPEIEKLLLKKFETPDQFVLRKLRLLEARLSAIVHHLSEPGRGGDGQFKAGSAITGKMMRKAYAPHAGKELLRKALAQRIRTK